MSSEQMSSEPSFSQKSHMRSEIKDYISFRNLDADVYEKLTEEIPRRILGKFTVQIFHQDIFLYTFGIIVGPFSSLR